MERGARVDCRVERHPRSRLAVLDDGGVKGEGAAGQKNDPGAKQQTSGKGKGGGKQGPGNAKTGAPRGKASKSGAAGKKGSPKQDQSGDQKGREDRAENKSDRDRKTTNRTTTRQENKAASKMASNHPTTNRTPAIQRTTPRRSSRKCSSRHRGGCVDCVVVVGAVAFLFGLFRYGQSSSTHCVQSWPRLFGGWGFQQPKKRAEPAEPESAEPALPPRPFSSFPDPFATGMDRNFSPNDLIIYSFEALEAWAFEHGLARSPHETPTEFVNRVGEARADLRQDTTRLAGYFVTIVYGQKGFKAEVLPPLRQFWQALQGFSA